MSINKSLQSYEAQFGEIDFKKGEDARSVYSPAAYLADLLQLLDDYFEGSDLKEQRRSDLDKIPLDAEHTFTLLPYLDIVNELLGKKVSASTPYETLRTATYPLNLPFNLHDEKVKLFLQPFDVSRESVYQLFNPEPDSAVATQAYLGLSSEMLAVILDADTETNSETDIAALKALYNLGENDDLKVLQEVSLFLGTTDCTADELLELVQPLGLNFQEIEVAVGFFTQAGLAGYTRLDDSENNLEWVSSDTANTTIPVAWFSRANRLLRLSRQTGISLNDLNLILRSCCQNRLDTTAIKYIAVIKQLASDYDLEIDVVCSFFSRINFHGSFLGSIDKNPPSKGLQLLLSRFNEKLPKQLLAVGDAGKDSEENEGTSLNDDSPAQLFLYHRVSKLAETLDITIQDIFNLLDVLEKDPYIRDYSGFNPLIHNNTNELNGYEILANGDMEASMWLVQLLFSLSQWMQKAQFSSSELKRILTGKLSNEAEQHAEEQRRVSGLNNLYQQFKPLLFTENYFVSDSIDVRTARVIYDVLGTDDTSLVSKQDKRLLTTDKTTAAEQAFYKALNQLQVISAYDFKGLAIHEKMQNKIFTHLILKGFIKPDGSLIESAFPESAEECSITHDFDNEAVFSLIHSLIHSIQQEQTDEEFPLFLTDLESLKLDDSKQKELYDNLLFNNTIDDEGNVLDPAFFAETANQSQFDANSDFDQYTQDSHTLIYALIKSKLSGFDTAEYSLDKSKFAALPLTDIELIDLLENLSFNDYLDENHNVINKAEVLDLKADDFKLALQYYPHRHQILEIIQSGLQDLKSRYYTLTKDDFSEVAEHIVAEAIYAQITQISQLQEDHLQEGDLTQLTEESQDFFADEDNVSQFELSPYFDNNSTLIVFKAIKHIVDTASRYRLNNESFAKLELNPEDITELLELLINRDYINNDKTLSASQITYFLNINNALDIKLEDFTDFSKDIFFVIHALAKTVDSAVNDLATRYTELATQQKDNLFAALQEMFEIPVDLVKVICRHVFDKNDSIIERFLLPILTALDPNERITELPTNPLFNIAFQRIQQFAWLSTKLGLNAVEADIVFRDQNLAQKYAEKLTLPEELEHIDCLFQLTINGDTFEKTTNSESIAEPVTEPIGALLLYSTENNSSWLYSANDYQYLGQINNLSHFSPLLSDLTINAAFNDQKGNAWIVSGNDFYYQQSGQLDWEKKEKELGKVQSNFDELDHIDAAFVDQEDKMYVFADDQYIRSSNGLASIDEGYPKQIKSNWKQELGLELPESYYESIDAAMQNEDEQLYFFKDEYFISSDDFATEKDIKQFWGKVKNNFTGASKDLERIDATLVHNNTLYCFAGDQCLTWSTSLENENGFADEGSIQSLSTLIPNLPDVFEDGVGAIFKGFDNKIHVFKDEHSLQCTADFTIEAESDDLSDNLKNDWGKVSNRITHTGRLSAAFSGLDGNTYLFSGTQYYRYSGGQPGNSYSYVDEGYPKNIASNWGGLTTVDAAFILDGKTYLIGSKGGKQTYLRYSSNDYTVQDVDYPKSGTANWWTDHFNLSSTDFNTNHTDNTGDFTKPDCVFLDQNGVTYLFKNQYYIAYDKLHRWWSEPKPIKDKWAAFKFDSVDAAFTGKDGRTYLFSATKYLRYTDKLFNKLDDRYPKTTRSFWGKVRNTIQKNNKIDAALVIEESERYTYLFSGNQYVRYSDDGNDSYGMVDEGYPKTIASSLKDEPRFKNLETDFTSIDAAFADKRNVYLFKDQHCTVVSDTDYKYYNNLLSETPGAVVPYEGKLYIENQDGWNTLTQLEGNALSTPTQTTPLRHILDDEIHDIDAAFVGTDNTTYIFRNGTCYNDALEHSYPINEEWGKTRNNIQNNNHIDAAFVGADGKTYLFSGDQYLSYTAEASPSALVDSHPKSISEDFGGLKNVNIAFIKDDKTWLVEAPDEDGNFRTLCFSSGDYSKPDGEAESADISWWEFPSIYIEEGFDHVDAVLFEDEHMYLFNGDQFIQYNKDDELWTYPRPINRIWRNIPFNDETGKNISTVFTDSANTTCFFSDSHVTAYANQSFSPAEEIKLNWGKLRNTIVQNNTVDAALVLDQTTYLFSGDQYVRYSSADYRYIDEGYPKTIIENLRQEETFTNLPESFDERIRELQPQVLQPQENETNTQPILTDARCITGIAANERNLYIFETNHCHVVSRTLTGQFPISRIGNINNQLTSNNHVDAAFVNQQNQTFLFSANQYVRYSDTDYEYVDAGYPKSIAEHFSTEDGGVTISANSSNANNGIDGAAQLASGKLMLFKGKEVYQSGTQDAVSLSQKIPSQQQTFTTPVNAGFVSLDGKTYFFTNGENGGQYIRYSDFDNEFVDEGFPRAIQDNWGNLPADFEKAIDHAFVFEGKTYLVNGNQYVRYSQPYSQPDYQIIDAIYPQTFTHRWGQKGAVWNDYLLSDVKIISSFKELLENNLSGNQSLSDLLNLELGYKKEPYQMLADIFGWDINEVKWLKRKNAFYKNELEVEVNFNIELVLKMQEIFKLADALGTSPTRLYTDIYQQDFEKNNPEIVAEYLYQRLEITHSDKDWQLLSSELHDKLNLIKHDALLPYVIADDKTVDNARDLFAKLLIDVNMGSEARTSKIKEATAAIQLYFHRYFVNLETFDTPVEKRDQLKQWWKWMRNYRVWEANRKVFLYPENYIRPELRDSKTPAFKSLEEALLQGEVTQDLVTTAFHNYLNEFAAVGNLKITGANVFEDSRYPKDQSLVLFGHTRTEPGQYYYRTARFTDTDTVLWDNWLPIDISINSTRVFPVYAFGRILVFWTEIEAYEESKPLILTDKSTSKIETEDTVLKHRANIKYSFYNFNKRWVNPQTLKRGVELEYKIDAAYTDVESKKLFTFSGEYCLTTTVDNPQGEVKKIKQVYPDLHESFHTGIDAAVYYTDQTGDKQLLFFKGDQCILNAGANPQPIANVFPGRFKIEEYAIFAALRWNNYVIPHPEEKPYQQGVSAVFTVENKICLIDYQGLPVFFEQSDQNVQNNGAWLEQEITDLGKVNAAGIHERPFLVLNEFIRIITRNFLRLEPVDAVFEDENGILYVLRKGQYECYKYDKKSFIQLEKIDGFPKPIKGNLSFNMDKFFNRLHVVATSEKGEDFISLTYTSPQANTALLTGKVKDDFTFEEGDLWVDQYKQALWDLSKTLSGSAIPDLVASATLPERIKTYFEEPSRKLDELIKLAELPAEDSTVLTNYQEAISIVQVVIDAQEALLLSVNDDNTEDDTDGSAFENISREDPEKVLVSDNDKKRFIRLMTGDNGVIKILNNVGHADHGDTAQAFYDSFDRFVGLIGLIDPPENTNWESIFENLKTKQSLAVSSQKALTETLASDIHLVTLRDTYQQNEISLNRANSQHFLAWHLYYNKAYKNYIKTLTYGQVLSAESQDKLEKIRVASNTYQDTLNSSPSSAWISALRDIQAKMDMESLRSQLKEAKTALGKFVEQLKTLYKQANTIETLLEKLPKSITDEANNQKERYFGRDDIFPADFGIENQANFTFSEPDWHIFEAKLGTFLCRPVEKRNPPPSSSDQPAYQYEIIRLTTTTTPKLSQALFSGGIDKLLTLNAQGIDEQPYFKPHPAVTRSLNSVDRVDGTPNAENTVFYNSALIAGDRMPVSKHLDYQGANSNYYWEIFFHAPFLIAQTLNDAQKFEEAKSWYEYIFDPTVPNTEPDNLGSWSFLPFKQASESRDLLAEDLNKALEVADLKTEIETYLNDPFDPHAIASIRQVAYQKSIVMRYVDNLLDWGDMLFGQYTMESITEARMLYILAYDLLGNKPQSIGNKVLPKTRNYSDLKNPTTETDLLLPTTVIEPGETTELVILGDTVHKTVKNPYFHIPENDLFLDYWNRVEDRLYKIRHSLNIEGVKQALALFQPSIDPMSIVQAVAGGGGLSQIMASSSVTIPHYRFSFMLNKSRELVQTLSQFSGELLGAIEKRDAEQLSLMQNKQEAVIQQMMTQVKEAQIKEARESIVALEASLDMVKVNETYNQLTYDDDFMPGEIAQMTLMSAALAGHLVSVIASTVASFGGAAPDAMVGPFIAGVKVGGSQLHDVAGSIADVAQTSAEGLSVGGELSGIVAQHKRMMADTLHQAENAEYDKKQIESQIAGAQQQLKIAEYELAIHEKEIEQHQSISNFMTSKFSSEQLYQWMSGKLSGLYYQTYKMAYDMAKAAEKSFQFERGTKESKVNYINGMYWNSQQKGLLAGESLGLDLDRMEENFIQTDKRRFEISKKISLLELDPMAFIRFKLKGECEFNLSEALFDYDFQGHYCRQVKTISIGFDVAEGQTVNATLSQLNHKTVMEADSKAVKHLLDPKDNQPLSIRSDWRASQQIALSHVDEYDKPNGLFELRYEDDRYLPFEGTGAVSRWRLLLNGKRGSVTIDELADATITIKYTALQGGEAFADAVRGLLKSYNTVRFFDLNNDFNDQWQEFLESDEPTLSLNMTREHFPNMASSRITGIFSKFSSLDSKKVSLILNNDDAMELRDEQFLETIGLSVSNSGSVWRFTVLGNKTVLKNVQLVVGYKAKV